MLGNSTVLDTYLVERTFNAILIIVVTYLAYIIASYGIAIAVPEWFFLYITNVGQKQNRQ